MAQFLTVLCTVLLLQQPLAAASLSDAKAALGQLAGFGQLAGAELSEDGGAFRLSAPDLTPGLQVWLANGEGGSWQALLLPAPGSRLDGEDLLPGAGRAVFGDAQITPAAVIVSTADASADPGAWPAGLKAALGDFGPLSLKKGVNGYLKASAGGSGALGQLAKGIGLGGGVIKVYGSTGPALLAKLLGAKAGKAAGPAPYALDLDLPAATPAVLAELGADAPFGVRFDSTHLSVQGEGPAYKLSGRQSVHVRILDKTLALDDALSFSQAAGGFRIDVDGSADADANLLGTEAIGFSVRKLLLSGDLAGQGKKLKGLGLGVGAQVDVSGAGSLRGDFDIQLQGKQVRELQLALDGAGGAIKLGGLPGIQELPGADEFELGQLGLGVRPKDRQAYVFGDLNWTTRGLRAAAVILAGKRELALFFKGQGLSLRKLSPAVPAELDVVPLDQAVVVLSRGKLDNLAPSMLPSPAQAMIDQVSGASGNKVSFSDGLTVMTSFTPAGALQQPMALLGLGGSPIVLAGAVGGVFRGDPAFAFSADLGRNPLPASAQPGFIKPRGAAPKFFLAARDLKTQPALDLGVDAGVALQLGADSLELGLRTYATLGQTGAGLRATGRMDGVWKDPLGLQTLSVADLVLGFGLDADSTVTLSLGGKLNIDGDKYDSAMTLGVLAATGTPKRLGLLFSGSELSPRVQLKLMDIFVRSAATGPLASALEEQDRANLRALAAGPSFSERAAQSIPLDLIAVRDFKAFLATPGASDPDLPGLSGTGVGLKGTLILDGKRAGKTDSYITDSDGLKLAGSIADFSLPGFLSLKDAKLDVRVPTPLGGLPSFKLKGESTTLLNKGRLDVELSLQKVKFISQSDWGAFGNAEIHAESFGPSLLQPTDFVLEMEAGADLKNGIRKQLAPAIDGLLADASAEDAKRLAAAKAELKDLQADYAKTKAAASKNQAKASDAIDDAQQAVKKWKGRLRDVKGDIKSTKKALARAKDEVKLDKAAELGLKLAALYAKKEGVNASYKVAKATLKAAKKVNGKVPVDLYPEVAAAKLAVDAKQTEIDEIQAGKQANRDLQAVSKAIKEGAKAIPIAVEEFSFKNGSMKAALRGEPQLVTLKLRVSVPKQRAFRLTEQLEVNLLNPSAMDLQAVADDIGDCLEDLSDGGDELPDGVELL